MNDRWVEPDATDLGDSDDDHFAGEFLNDDESYDDPSADLIPCPQCRERIFADSVRCPSCGHYILEEARNDADQSPIGRQFFIAVVLVVIVALLLPFLLVLFSMLRAMAR